MPAKDRRKEGGQEVLRYLLLQLRTWMKRAMTWVAKSSPRVPVMKRPQSYLVRVRVPVMNRPQSYLVRVRVSLTLTLTLIPTRVTTDAC